jgi:hypothetical protein
MSIASKDIQIETMPLDGRITLRIASEKSE